MRAAHGARSYQFERNGQNEDLCEEGVIPLSETLVMRLLFRRINIQGVGREVVFFSLAAST